MRLLFSLLLSLCIARTIAAQDNMLGAKLGGGLSSITNVHPQQKAAFSFLGGLSYSFAVDPRAELQAEVLYAQRGYSYTERGYSYPESEVDDARVRVALHYLDIPLTARFAVIQKPAYSLLVIMGGYIGFLLDATASPTPNLPVRVTDSRSTDAGVIGGIAVDMPLAENRLSFEARCTYGLRELGEQYDYPLVPIDSPPTAILHQLSGSTIAVTISAAYCINLSR